MVKISKYHSNMHIFCCINCEFIMNYYLSGWNFYIWPFWHIYVSTKQMMKVWKVRMIASSCHFWSLSFLFSSMMLRSYILKAKKFAESAFHSQKICGKVRKSRHWNFATKVRKSLKKKVPKMLQKKWVWNQEHVHYRVI